MSSSTSPIRKGTGWFLCSLLVGTMLEKVAAYYKPGVEPVSYGEGEYVGLKVNKMTSTKTLLPLNYYQLPYCQPVERPKTGNQNLGEVLAGDRIQSSPYILRMNEDMYCKPLCVSNIGRSQLKGASPNKVVQAIQKNYKNNWIVDNLPAANKLEDESTITQRYWGGFPVGFIHRKDQKAYLNNHVNIEIMIHPEETEPNKFRIVRFTVQPFSILHEFELYDEDTEPSGYDEFKAQFIDPIPSCDPNRKTSIHTDYDMIKRMEKRDGQPASGKVLFTYDVIWTVNTDVKWASRWDIYLSMDNAIPANVHLWSIVNSLAVVLTLSAAIVAIILRDFAQHDNLALDEEKAKDLEGFGVRLVRADLFRPPAFSPLLLSVLCGTGAQILSMCFLIAIFSAMGYISPATRGALLIAVIMLYVMMGGIGGYVTARLYKMFKGESRHHATTCTALAFPGIAFVLLILRNLIASAQSSTAAVPLVAMMVLLLFWFGINTPLVFFGAYLGYKEEVFQFPLDADTKNIPRGISDQPWFLGIPFALAFGGLLPFGAIFSELVVILNSMLIGFYYDAFEFLLLLYILFIVICAEVAVLFCYIQLKRENYDWWWRSFCIAGSFAVYVFFYSFVIFTELGADSFVVHVLYFGFMGFVCLGLFLMMGFVGVLSSLQWNRAILYHHQD